MSEVKATLDTAQLTPEIHENPENKDTKPLFIVKNYYSKKPSPKKKMFVLEKKKEIVQNVNWIKTVQLNEQDLEDSSNESEHEELQNKQTTNKRKSQLKKGLLLGGLIGGSMGLYYYLNKNQ